jgi:hypothetical protein
MTSINHVDFQLKRIKDTFVLVNLTEDTLTFELFKDGCEGVFTSVITGEVLALESNTLTILSDGFYRLVVNGTIVYFSALHHYRNRLVELVRESVCKDCGCKPVNCMPKEAVDCLRNQSLFNFMQVYINLVKPYSLSTPATLNPFLFTYYQDTIYNNKCYIIEELCKQLLDTSITGASVTNPELFNYFIAVSYLGLYMYDVTNVNTSILTNEEVTEELLYLDTVYNYKSIKKCIKHLGIDINDLITIDTNNVVVHYWQLTNTEDDINDVLSLITSAYLDTKNTDNFSVFNEGKVVNYTSVGRVVFAIKETTLQNFVILDSLGNNITDDFDVDYIAPLQCVVYVSKSIYTHSNMFFKFKTLLDD